MDRVGLRPLERIVLAAAIVGGQPRKELTNQATAVIRTEFDSAVLELCQNPPLEHADFNTSQLTKLISNLLSDVPQDAPVLDANQRQALIFSAQTKLGKEVLAPILHRVFAKLRYESLSQVV